MAWFKREPTAPPAARWSDHHDRPRVLVEASDGAMRWAAEGILRKAGYDVRSCAGPDGFTDGRCPLAGHGVCSLAHDADLVFNQLGVRDAPKREVVAALKRELDDTPIIVEATGLEEEHEHSLLDGTMVVRPSPSSRRMVEQVSEALAGL